MERVGKRGEGSCIERRGSRRGQKGGREERSDEGIGGREERGGEGRRGRLMECVVMKREKECLWRYTIRC